MAQMARTPRWTAYAAGLQAVWRGSLAGTVAATFLFVPPAALAQVDVGKPSSLRNLVPADQLEGSAAQQYGDLKRQAAAKGALAPDNHPQVRRLRDIAAQIIPFAGKWNPRAAHWRWEVNLIGSRQITPSACPAARSPSIRASSTPSS